MPPLEIDGAKGFQAMRRVAVAAARPLQSGTASSSAARPANAARGQLDPGQPPVDPERVAQIRKAVQAGNYPLLPARIADAMIAAGMLLTKGE